MAPRVTFQLPTNEVVHPISSTTRQARASPYNRQFNNNNANPNTSSSSSPASSNNNNTSSSSNYNHDDIHSCSLRSTRSKSRAPPVLRKSISTTTASIVPKDANMSTTSTVRTVKSSGNSSSSSDLEHYRPKTPGSPELWRKPGKAFRARLILHDETAGGKSFSLSDDCPIHRYYQVADRVLDQFLSHPVDTHDDLIEAYMVGTRLMKFISSVLPTHRDYMRYCKDLRDLSQSQLVHVVQYLEQIAFQIDKYEHERYIQHVLNADQTQDVDDESSASTTGDFYFTQNLPDAPNATNIHNRNNNISVNNTTISTSATDILSDMAVDNMEHDRASRRRASREGQVVPRRIHAHAGKQKNNISPPPEQQQEQQYREQEQEPQHQEQQSHYHQEQEQQNRHPHKQQQQNRHDQHEQEQQHRHQFDMTPEPLLRIESALRKAKHHRRSVAEIQSCRKKNLLDQMSSSDEDPASPNRQGSKHSHIVDSRNAGKYEPEQKYEQEYWTKETPSAHSYRGTPNMQEVNTSGSDTYRRAKTRSGMEVRKEQVYQLGAEGKRAYSRGVQEQKDEEWVDAVWDPSPSFAAELSSFHEHADEVEDIDEIISRVRNNRSPAGKASSSYVGLSSEWSFAAAPELSWTEHEGNDRRVGARQVEIAAAREAASTQGKGRQHDKATYDPFTTETSPEIRRKMPSPVIKFRPTTECIVRPEPSPTSVQELDGWRDQFRTNPDDTFYYSPEKKPTKYRALSSYSRIQDEAERDISWQTDEFISSHELDNSLPVDESKVTALSTRRNRLKPFKDCVKCLLD